MSKSQEKRIRVQKGLPMYPDEKYIDRAMNLVNDRKPSVSMLTHIAELLEQLDILQEKCKILADANDLLEEEVKKGMALALKYEAPKTKGGV